MRDCYCDHLKALQDGYQSICQKKYVPRLLHIIQFSRGNIRYSSWLELENMEFIEVLVCNANASASTTRLLHCIQMNEEEENEDDLEFGKADSTMTAASTLLQLSLPDLLAFFAIYLILI